VTASSTWRADVRGAARAVGAFALRDLAERQAFRYALVLDLAFGILNLVTFSLISRVVSVPDTAELDGASTYFSFAAVGIAFMLVIQSAAAGVAQRVRQEQQVGTLEALVAQPVAPGTLALGLTAFPFAFALVRSAAYLAVAALFLDLESANADWLGVIVILVASGAAVTALGIVVAAMTVVVPQGQMVGRLLVFALGFLGGAYFPVSQLPAGLEAIAQVVPTRFALDGLRATLSGSSDWWGDLGLLVAFGAIGLPIALLVFRAAVRLAVRRGRL